MRYRPSDPSFMSDKTRSFQLVLGGVEVDRTERDLTAGWMLDNLGVFPRNLENVFKESRENAVFGCIFIESLESRDVLVVLGVVGVGGELNFDMFSTDPLVQNALNRGQNKCYRRFRYLVLARECGVRGAFVGALLTTAWIEGCRKIPVLAFGSSWTNEMLSKRASTLSRTSRLGKPLEIPYIASIGRATVLVCPVPEAATFQP